VTSFRFFPRFNGTGFWFNSGSIPCIYIPWLLATALHSFENTSFYKLDKKFLLTAIDFMECLFPPVFAVFAVFAETSCVHKRVLREDVDLSSKEMESLRDDQCFKL